MKVALLIGFSYEYTSRSSVPTKSYVKAISQKIFQRLPGIIVDLYLAYLHALAIKADRIVIITDIYKNQETKILLDAMVKGIVDNGILTFITDAAKLGHIKLYKNKSWIRNVIKETCEDANQLFIYYTGHQLDGYFILPYPRNHAYHDSDIISFADTRLESRNSSWSTLGPLTKVDTIPSTHTYKPISTLTHISTSTYTHTTIPSTHTYTPSAHTYTPSAHTYTTIPSAHTHAVDSYNDQPNICLASTSVNESELDQLKFLNSSLTSQNAFTNISFIGNLPPLLENNIHSKFDIQNNSLFVSTNLHTMTKMKGINSMNSSMNSGKNDVLSLDSFRDDFLAKTKSNVQTFLVLDCCQCDGIRLPFLLSPDNVYRLSPSKNAIYLDKEIVCICSSSIIENSIATINGSLFSISFYSLIRSERDLFKIISRVRYENSKYQKAMVYVTLPTIKNVWAWMTHDSTIDVEVDKVNSKLIITRNTTNTTK